MTYLVDFILTETNISMDLNNVDGLISGISLTGSHISSMF